MYPSFPVSSPNTTFLLVCSCQLLLYLLSSSSGGTGCFPWMPVSLFCPPHHPLSHVSPQAEGWQWFGGLPQVKYPQSSQTLGPESRGFFPEEKKKREKLDFPLVHMFIKAAAVELPRGTQEKSEICGFEVWFFLIEEGIIHLAQ